MTYTPLVSVIIPAYNSAEFIKDAINSVLNQTYKNLEVIVVDDSSEDNTIEIAKEMASRDDRIKVYSIEHSGRPAVPRNFGISKAEGALTAFLDSDDVWTPYKLEKQVPYFNKIGNLCFVYSVSVTFGKVKFFSPIYEVLPLFFRASRTRSDLLKKGNTVPLSSVLVKTDLLLKAGGFDEDPLLQVEDFDLWLRLSELGPFLFIPRLHVLYRIHDFQFSGDWNMKSSRLKYLASKRGLALPEYRFIRRKSGFWLLIRNIIHFKALIWVRMLGFFDRIR